VGVSVEELRADLRRWVHRARDGEEVVITDEGTPIARMTGLTRHRDERTTGPTSG
jgi:prevent-host-death family protein